MWDNKYDPPPSLFDEIEPFVFTVLVIAMLVIIPFTPLSPFSSREQSALDQLAGVNALPSQQTVSAPGLERQAKAPVSIIITR